MADMAIKKNAGVSLADLCKKIGFPLAKLQELLKEAGIADNLSADAILTEEQKLKLFSTNSNVIMN